MSLWRSVCGLMILAMVLGGLPVQAQTRPSEKRIALVIGNGAYQDGQLATPANDAGLIAQTLQAAGFDVVGARDLDTATLRASFREFIDKAAASGPDTVAMVYYAGYGLQFEGQNYLVPTDARIAQPADVPLAAVRLNDVLGPLAAVPLKARLIVLDAARNTPFARTDKPLAGGLALMQPDRGTLIAFNAAPGTIAPEGKAYSAYATALSEMIKAGGLSLDDLFERVRLRASELTQGAQIPWYATKVEAPFLFFERTASAPQEQTRFTELRRRPIPEFDAHDAYLAALTRDTMAGYQEFLLAYPADPLAPRVRAILAVRREAIVWRESAIADTPDAYWSYLRRYPRGLHAWDARRRLDHFAVAYEPLASFTALAYDVPPPPPDEIVYIERPVVYLADPVFALPPPPPVPVFFLPPRPVYYVDLPPPPPPFAAFVLPIPIWHPVPEWVDRPAYVAPPPINLINVNIHNTVVVNQAAQSVTVTNPQGQQVSPLPTAPTTSPAPAAAGQPGTGGPLQSAAQLVQSHPATAAAIAATAAALPAAALLRSRQLQHTGPAPAAGQQNHPAISGLPGFPGTTVPATSARPLPSPATQPPPAAAVPHAPGGLGAGPMTAGPMTAGPQHQAAPGSGGNRPATATGPQPMKGVNAQPHALQAPQNQAAPRPGIQSIPQQTRAPADLARQQAAQQKAAQAQRQAAQQIQVQQQRRAAQAARQAQIQQQRAARPAAQPRAMQAQPRAMQPRRPPPGARSQGKPHCPSGHSQCR